MGKEANRVVLTHAVVVGLILVTRFPGLERGFGTEGVTGGKTLAAPRDHLVLQDRRRLRQNQTNCARAVPTRAGANRGEPIRARQPECQESSRELWEHVLGIGIILLVGLTPGVAIVFYLRRKTRKAMARLSIEPEPRSVEDPPSPEQGERLPSEDGPDPAA
jgi:hypothetical protein